MNSQSAQFRIWQTLAEIVLVFAIFALHGAYPTPDSNEAHYLAKAKHYWNPDWAAGDFFLKSADAHQVFYWTFGWLTLWFSLDIVAWIGRILTWILLAVGWQRLSIAAVPRAWYSLLAAAAFVGLNENAHMAGEWVVGGFEAKGFAYALVFFALACIVHEKWPLAWVLLGLATALHVLVGGWAMIAAGCAWLAMGSERPPLRSVIPTMALALVIALPSVYFALALTRGVDAATVAESGRIYVFERLPHHLYSDRMAAGFVTRHLLLQAVWLLIVTFTPARAPGGRAFRWFIGATIAVCWFGLAATLLLRNRPEWLSAVMRYYWFRSSDVFAAMGVALELTGMIAQTLQARPIVARSWLVGALVLVGIDTVNQLDHLPFVVPGIHDTPATPRTDKNMNYNDWVDVCRWIEAHTERTDRVLTPRMAATFKWRTGRPEVATWKDVPQDARSIVEWWDRMNRLHGTGLKDAPWYASFSEQGVAALAGLMKQYDARYVIVPLRADLEPLPVEPVYRNGSYAVYSHEQLERH